MKNGKFAKTYLGLFMAFLYAPIGVLIVFSFNQSKSRSVFTGFTFDWYAQLFQNRMILQSLGNTLIVAAISSVAATLLGTMAAIGINSMNKRMKSVMMNLTYVPVINPEIVTGVSLMLLFVFLRIKFGFTTLILAHITFNVSYVILNVMPKLRQMDKNIFDAALDLGCTPVKAFFKVVIYEIMPGIVAGFLTAFTFSVDDFVISYFTTGVTSQTLPITIYSMTRKKVSPEINALSTVIFVVVLTILLLVNLNDTRKSKNQLKERRASF